MEKVKMGSKTVYFVQASPSRRLVRKACEILLARLPVGRVLGALPFFRRYYKGLVMARTDHTGLYFGIYGSYAEALADVPASRLAGWDHEDSSTLWVDQIDPVKLSTYPVFFWLSQLYQRNWSLVDVGGSIGLTYYGYRRFVGLPENSTWTIVEVPKICEQGRKIAQRENAAGLNFVSDAAQVDACDLLLSAGALQFVENSLPGLLESLPRKPRFILLNKLPITDQEDCWTLQNYGPAVTPHRLFNRITFLRYFDDHDYRLRDSWEVQDLDCLIPFHPQRFIRHFSGFLFELKQ
jgi:putative methyltransferase (TIGR04325 family)